MTLCEMTEWSGRCSCPTTTVVGQHAAIDAHMLRSTHKLNISKIRLTTTPRYLGTRLGHSCIVLFPKPLSLFYPSLSAHNNLSHGALRFVAFGDCAYRAKLPNPNARTIHWEPDLRRYLVRDRIDRLRYTWTLFGHKQVQTRCSPTKTRHLIGWPREPRP